MQSANSTIPADRGSPELDLLHWIQLSIIPKTLTWLSKECIHCIKYDWILYIYIPKKRIYCDSRQILFYPVGLLYYSCIKYYFYSLRVFHISVCWVSFTGVRMTTSLPKSTGLSSVFWWSLQCCGFGLYSLVFFFPILLVILPILWWLWQEHLLQWV